MKELSERGKNITTSVETPSGDIFKMSVFEYSRWLSLIEAVGLIEEEAEREKVDLDSFDWIQPIALEKFVRERSGDILHNLMHDVEFLSLCDLSSATNS